LIKVRVKINGLEAWTKWAGEAGRRARKYEAAVLHRTAKNVFLAVQDSLPATAGELRKSLQFVKVQRGKAPMYLIRVQAKARKAKEKDVKNVILDVTAKNTLVRLPPPIAVLIEHNPWTLDTIPFSPEVRFAVVTERRVSAWAVDEVKKARVADSVVWKRKLLKFGVRARASRVRKDLQVVSDLYLQSVSLEFGLGGAYHPHWRPAILKNAAPEKVAAMMRSAKDLSRILSPRFKGWKKWPPPVAQQVGLSETKRYQEFEKKLGIL
jgi:hypothetical protein